MEPTTFAGPSRLLPSQGSFSTGSVFLAKHDTQWEKAARNMGKLEEHMTTGFEDTLAYNLP